MAIGGRPKAAELKRRCSAKNAHGGQCGNPPMPGAQICTLHLGRADPKKLAKTSDRLIKLTTLALDRLERIITTGDDDVAERASRTILDRTVPKPSAQHATIINLPGMGADLTGDGGAAMTPAELIRERLAQLAEISAAPRPGWDAAEDLEIIDAEIVDESEAS